MHSSVTQQLGRFVESAASSECEEQQSFQNRLEDELDRPATTGIQAHLLEVLLELFLICLLGPSGSTMAHPLHRLQRSRTQPSSCLPKRCQDAVVFGRCLHLR